MGLIARTASFGFCIVIALVPLPFGSVQLTPIAIWVSLLATILLAAQTHRISTRDAVVIGTFALLAVLWTAIIILQSINTPLTAQLAYPIWVETSRMLGIAIPSLVTAARDAPMYAAGAQIACALSFLCGYFLGRDGRLARLILKAFAYSALVYAVYGILAFIVAPNYALWIEKVQYQNVLTSTFINANTAAVYFGSASVVWMLLVLESLHGHRSPHERQWSYLLVEHNSSRTIRRVLCLVVVIAATFMSGSRLGSMLTLFVTIGTVALFYRAQLSSWHTVLYGSLLAAIFAVAVMQIFGGHISQRVSIEGFADNLRLQTYFATLRIIEDFPWLGTGLGTFRWVYPKYRSVEIPIAGIWDRAHSTTLELAAEMGIPFAAIVVVAWASILFCLARGVVRRRKNDVLPISALCVSLIGVLHSQLDFSLQIPGFAIIVLGLAGMGLAQSAPRVESRGGRL